MGQIFITPSEEAQLQEKLGRKRQSSFARRAIRFEPSSQEPTPSQSPDPEVPPDSSRDVSRAKSKTEYASTVQEHRTGRQSRRSFRGSLSTLRSPSPSVSVPIPQEKRIESFAPVLEASLPAPRDAAPARVERAVLPNASPSAPQRRERGLGHRHNAQTNLRADVDENIRKPSLLAPLLTCCTVVAVGAAIMGYSLYYLSQQQYGTEEINLRALDARRDNDTVPRHSNATTSGGGGISSDGPPVAETDSNVADRDFNTLGQDTIALVLGRGN